MKEEGGVEGLGVEEQDREMSPQGMGCSCSLISQQALQASRVRLNEAGPV